MYKRLTKLAVITIVIITSCSKQLPQNQVDSFFNEDVSELDGARVYVAHNSQPTMSDLYCYDAKTGAQKWESRIRGHRVAEPLCASLGKIYVGTNYPNVSVIALDGNTGEIQWTTKLNAGELSVEGISVFDGILYLTSINFIYAVDANAGNLIWTYKNSRIFNDFLNAPTVSNGIFYCTSSKSLIALNANTGEVKWIDSNKNFGHSSPCVVRDNIFCTRVGKGLQRSDTSGRVKWVSTFDNPESYQSSPMINKGTVITHATLEKSPRYQKDVIAIDAKTGAQKWKHSFYPFYISAGCEEFITDKYVFTSLYDSMVGLKADTGEELWRTFTPENYVYINSVLSVAKMVFITAGSSLTALKATDGNIVWSVDLDDRGDDPNTKMTMPAVVSSSGIAIHPAESGMTQ